MGEDARAGGSQVTDAGPREPTEIREDIDSTRREMGDTVEALAEKTDVKSQVQKKVADVKQNVDAKREELMGRARKASPDTASSTMTTVGQKARENPVPVAIAGAFAAGLILGRITNR
ncbi:MAG: hypothetical protein V7607_1378 [Solirubrobacteraceae bacterium]